MEFEVEYAEEQEAFRQEVRAWIAVNVPVEIVFSPDPADYTLEQYEFRRALGRKLGAKGWLYPTMPREYGGGGLTMELAIILYEEMGKIELSIPPYYDTGGLMGAPTILVWGSEEQKRRFLPPILSGQANTWQLLTEPEAGSDLAGVKMTAIRDGDEYVVNGQKVFVGGAHRADQYWTICVTDPNGKRHQNVSWFMIPSDLPGITVRPMELLATDFEQTNPLGPKNVIYFENVRVPASHLVGGENQGWRAASTHLEVEHGGAGDINRDYVIDRFYQHCRQATRNERPLSDDPDVSDLMVDVYIEEQINRLFGLRNYYLAHSGKSRSYEGSQATYSRKLSILRMAQTIHQALGYSALTKDPKWGVADGWLEYYSRHAIQQLHPGGTGDVQKVIMARRIGIGRSEREAAGAIR